MVIDSELDHGGLEGPVALILYKNIKSAKRTCTINNMANGNPVFASTLARP